MYYLSALILCLGVGLIASQVRAISIAHHNFNNLNDMLLADLAAADSSSYNYEGPKRTDLSNQVNYSYSDGNELSSQSSSSDDFENSLTNRLKNKILEQQQKFSFTKSDKKGSGIKIKNLLNRNRILWDVLYGR